MRVIIDTNVIISGIFFNGPPFDILQLWKKGQIKLVLNKEIFQEYSRVCDEISKKIESNNVNKILSLISLNSEAVTPVELPDQICDDPDDDKFIACALGSGVKTIISGDKHLLRVNGVFNLEMIKPKPFLNKYFA